MNGARGISPTIPMALRRGDRAPLHLYVHIPFCHSKCAYCDFVSRPGFRPEDVAVYVEALKAEMTAYANLLRRHTIRSVYFGGGTPSAISPAYIQELLSHLRTLAVLAPDAECTLEVNPGTLTSRHVATYVDSGINRMSIGLQTPDEALLRDIGRTHQYAHCVEAVELARGGGIDNISLDLMFGLPGQTLKHIDVALEAIEALSPTHVSAYGLKLEEGTPMYAAVSAGRISLPDEAIERDMCRRIERGLADLGVHQYEISNFARPGFEAVHNTAYWENRQYLGFGVSAHSKYALTRYANTADISAYTALLSAEQRPLASSEALTREEDLFETLMLGLRLNAGICCDTIASDYGIDFWERYGDAVSELLSSGLMTREHVACGMVLRLTEKGRDFSNRVFLAFMP